MGTRLSKLNIIVGIVGILSQILWMPAIQAQSIVGKRLCTHSGKYVVFAQRTGANKQIFFCNNQKVERNIGSFDDSQRTSGETLNKKYTVDDDEQYNTDVVENILDSEQCYVSESEAYGTASNRCENFIDRVRQQYWRKMFIGTWEGVFPCGPGHFILRYEIKDNNLIQTVIQHGGDNCLPNGHTSTIGQIPKNVFKGTAFTITLYLGTGSQTRLSSIRIIDANTFECEGNILRRVTSN